MSGAARTVRGVTVLVVVVGVLVVALWQVNQLKTRASQAAPGAGARLTLYPGKQGVPLPQVAGRTITGGRLSLQDLRGNVVVVNVWGSWCAPCRAEAPDLAKISRATASRGVRFVGIDVRDNPAAGLAFERRYKIASRASMTRTA